MKKLYLICDEYTSESLLRFFLEQADSDNFELTLIKDGVMPAIAPGSGLILASGHTDAQLSPELLATIVTNTLEGGSLLMLAGGMLHTKVHELSLLSSARLLRRLPYGEISIQRTDSPLTSGFDANQLWDEACIFERSAFDNSIVLLSMTIGEMEYPVVWTRPWFLGHVYCVGSVLVPSALQSYAPVLKNILHAMIRED